MRITINQNKRPELAAYLASSAALDAGRKVKVIYKGEEIEVSPRDEIDVLIPKFKAAGGGV